MKLINYIIRFWNIPPIEKNLFIKGFLLIGALSFLLAFLPFKSVYSLFKIKPRFISPEVYKARNIRLVRKTLKRLEIFYTIKTGCLIKSVTFKLLLNYLGVESKIELGIMKQHPGLLKAHAYVVADGRIVYLKKEGFTRLLTID
jgi:hypothetical protein